MIGIIDYGMGNTRSVQKAIEFLGERAEISGKISALDKCSRLILPGVGSFGAGIENLRAARLAEYIMSRVHDTPVLGICLGMQFLLDASEEAGKHAGLGLIGGTATRFTAGKIPHMGWNSVYGLKSPLFNGIGDGAQFYFVHSYRAKVTEDTIAVSDYYGEFSAAIACGNAYGVQFHPEKSGEAGLCLLKNFMRL